MKPTITVKDVVKTFGKQTVLKGVSLEVDPGEIIGLVGPSGCGKTTLVNLIVGLAVPNSGQVCLLEEEAPYEQARKMIGFMPQDVALYEDITANENLRFFGSMYRMNPKEIARAGSHALELAHLQDEGKKVVSAFSGGMKRRLSLAVAILHNPKILILDEPTIGLDPVHRAQLWQSFRELAEDGASVLMTTHVMEEASRCNRIAMLREGELIAFDTPGNIIASTGSTNLEEAFVFLALKEKTGASHV